MRICAKCHSRMSDYANKCSYCGSTRSLLTEFRIGKTKEEIVEMEEREKAIADLDEQELNVQIEILIEDAKKKGTTVDWSCQPPQIQYRYYCKRIEDTNRINQEPKPINVFSFQTGYVSDRANLIRYTQQGRIVWNYCQPASFYNEKKDEFCLVFVSSTYCILEIQVRGKKSNRVYSGYLKLGKDKEFESFEEWRTIYTKIKNINKEWDTKILLKNLKDNNITYRETNWTKIVLVSAKDAKITERSFNPVYEKQVPMSYARFLREVVYTESWGACGMSGGAFSPR